MSKLRSYTSHNFSAVNDHLDQISKREKAKTFSYWLKSFETLFMYIVITAFVFTLLILSLSWSYRFINAPYIDEKLEIVRPEIIEKEVLKVIKVPSETQMSENIKFRSNSPSINYVQPNNTITGSSESINYLTNFNQFNIADVPMYEKYGFSSIITGYRFKDSESNSPEHQYCYFNRSGAEPTIRTRIDLAEIDQEGIYNSFIDSNLALGTQIDEDTLNEIQKYCLWTPMN